MCGEALAEIVQGSCIGGGIARQALSQLSDGHMIAEDRQDERMVRIAVSGVAGEQDLLLQLKVDSSVLSPEVEEGRAHVGRAVAGGSPH